MLCSPVFRSMLGGEMQEGQTKSVSVENFKRTDFEQFYRFLNPATMRDERLTDDSVMQIFALADYYQVASLKKFCEQHLNNMSTTASLLIHAKKFRLDTLYERCVDE